MFFHFLMVHILFGRPRNHQIGNTNEFSNISGLLENPSSSGPATSQDTSSGNASSTSSASAESSHSGGGSDSSSSKQSKKKLSMSGNKRKRIRYVKNKFRVARAKKSGEGESGGESGGSSGIEFKDAPEGKKTLEIDGHRMCHKAEGDNEIGDCEDGNKNVNKNGWNTRELKNGIVLLSEDKDGNEQCLTKEKGGEMKMKSCKQPGYDHQKFEMSDYVPGGNDGEGYDEFETLEAIEEDEDDSSLTEEENEMARENKKKENEARKAVKNALGVGQPSKNDGSRPGATQDPNGQNNKLKEETIPNSSMNNRQNLFSTPKNDRSRPTRGPDKSQKSPKNPPEDPNNPSNGHNPKHSGPTPPYTGQAQPTNKQNANINNIAPPVIQNPNAPLDPNKLTEPPFLTPNQKMIFESLKNTLRETDANLKKFLSSPELNVNTKIQHVTAQQIQDSLSQNQNVPTMKPCCVNKNGCRYEMKLVCTTPPICC